jgi:hypothetical protein
MPAATDDADNLTATPDARQPPCDGAGSQTGLTVIQTTTVSPRRGSRLGRHEREHVGGRDLGRGLAHQSKKALRS